MTISMIIPEVKFTLYQRIKILILPYVNIHVKLDKKELDNIKFIDENSFY